MRFVEDSQPGKHCQNRLWEWGAAIAMLLIGILLDAWPDALLQSKFRFMVNVLGPESFTIFYQLFGAIRISALFLSGSAAPYPAYVRALTAVCGGFCWFHMGFSLFVAQESVGAAPSPSVPLFLVLVVLELYSLYRALGDARYRYR